MKKEKKELLKKFKVVVEDLLDNYENYTAEEKSKVKEVFEKVADLNAILDKYDVEKQSFWKEYCDAVTSYFANVNMGL